MKKRVLSLLLAGVMAVGMLSGCGKEKDTPKEPSDTKEEGQTKEDEKGDKEASGSDTPLVVGYLPFSEKFSPFFADSGYDNDATDMTQVKLLTLDREGGIIYNAIEGETVPYNGTDYTYSGPADIDVNIDETSGDTTYMIKLRDDLKFSDGEALNIDDVIFNIYALCDNDYDGSVTLSSQPIKGLKEYRANSTAASSVTDEMVAAKLTEMPEAVATEVKAYLADVLKSEYAWVEETVVPDPASYGLEAGVTAEAAFAALYGTDEAYDAAGKDAATVLADVTAMYGTDYKKLATAYASDETYYDADMNEIAYNVCVEELRAAGEGEEVPNIAGVERIDDYSLKLVTDGYAATTIYQLEIGIAPLHYYADESLYDYENNSFGFPRGDLSLLREKTTKPMGAGAYIFDKFENKTIYYTANENFYKGAPKIKSLQFKESTEADKIPGIEQGTIDLSDPSGSKAAFDQIGGINGNGELIGDVMVTSTVDNLGYGYLGANADTVNVGGESGSDASKNLRRAFMTILSVYRDVAIDSYYGAAASVINYPISNTSWAAPQKSDPDYQVAYSTDVAGNPIYTDGMSADDKYKAAVQAALGFFEAAGFTVADGKVTAAPQGAKLEYELIIGADGVGDHPAFSVITDASAALETIGIKLAINDPADTNILWNAIDAGTQEFWVAAWQATVDPDMHQTYHSSNVIGKGGTNSNHYHITDPALDSLIMEARQSDDKAFRKAEYKQCLDLIMDWSVELPIYQRQNCIVYSAERINVETMTPDITTFYKWFMEIQNIEMN